MSIPNKPWLSIHHAALLGDVKLLKIAIEHQQYDIATPINSGSTALHLVISSGNFAALRYLLSHDAVDVNIRNNAGITPLHIACQLFGRYINECIKKPSKTILKRMRVYREMVTYLIFKGADSTLKTNNGTEMLLALVLHK